MYKNYSWSKSEQTGRINTLDRPMIFVRRLLSGFRCYKITPSSTSLCCFFPVLFILRPFRRKQKLGNFPTIQCGVDKERSRINFLVSLGVSLFNLIYPVSICRSKYAKQSVEVAL